MSWWKISAIKTLNIYFTLYIYKMCPHPLCHLILTNPAGGHCQYPRFKDEQTISRGYDLSRCKSTAKTQTPDFCSLSLILMLMKTLLVCNLEIGTGPREEAEALSWVVRLALMKSEIMLKGYYFFSFGEKPAPGHYRLFTSTLPSPWLLWQSVWLKMEC